MSSSANCQNPLHLSERILVFQHRSRFKSQNKGLHLSKRILVFNLAKIQESSHLPKNPPKQLLIMDHMEYTRRLNKVEATSKNVSCSIAEVPIPLVEIMDLQTIKMEKSSGYAISTKTTPVSLMCICC